MRTLGFRTHVLVVLAAAAGLAVSLGRPWYGAGPAQIGDTDVGQLDGPIRALWGGITRLGTNTGESGWHTLGPWGTVLAGGGLAMAGTIRSNSTDGISHSGFSMTPMRRSHSRLSAL